MDDLLKDWSAQQDHQSGNEGWKEIEGIPSFQHPEVLWLYGWGFDIPQDLVRRLLSLPRESLISDLETVIADAETRYAAYSDLDSEEKPLPLSLISFPVHATFLLAELGATASLGKICRFLSKGSDLVDFWMGDHLSEDLWIPLLKLGKDNFERLQKFVRNHDADYLARAAAVTAVGQVAWHYPGRRKEVFAWFEAMFQYFVEHFDHDAEAELLGEAVDEVANLRAKDLLEAIEELFRADLVDSSVCGTFGEVQGTMYEPVNNWAKLPIKNIYETYQHFTDTWDVYTDEGDDDDEQLVRGGSYLASSTKKKPLASINPNAGPQRKGATPGRNDLCPCGSGLKYKKCHG